jgi:hypothetical protein
MMATRTRTNATATIKICPENPETNLEIFPPSDILRNKGLIDHLSTVNIGKYIMTNKKGSYSS